MLDVVEALAEVLRHNRRAVLATVTEVVGASPARPGFKMLVELDGRRIGNVGGGRLQQRIGDDAVSLLTKGGDSCVIRYGLREEGEGAIGTACGGDVTVFLEHIRPRPTLLVVGSGQVGRPLVELARILGYQTAVVDIDTSRGGQAVLNPEAVTDTTYAVVMTEDHVTDEQALRTLLDTPAAYIGVIGSFRKISRMMANVVGTGFPADRLACVRAPLGLDLGGRQPAEIALAVLAEIELVRHGGSGRPRSEGLDKDGTASTAAGERSADSSGSASGVDG